MKTENKVLLKVMIGKEQKKFIKKLSKDWEVSEAEIVRRMIINIMNSKK